MHIKKIIFLVLGFILCVSGRVSADGCFFFDRDTHLTEPEQKAVIVWDGTQETMLLSSRVMTENINDLERIAWVIPIESSDQPRVTAGSMDVFKSLVRYFVPGPSQDDWLPRLDDGRRPESSYAGGVNVLEQKKVDIYDIAVLRADDAGKLMQWLHDNGFVVPDKAEKVLDGYIKAKKFYFVVNKIDLANKFGGRSKELQTFLDLIIKEGPVREDLMKYAGNCSGMHVHQDEARYLSNRELWPIFEDIRNAIAVSLLEGVPYEKSIAANQAVQMLDFISKEKYAELLKTCTLKLEIYKKTVGMDENHIEDAFWVDPMFHCPFNSGESFASKFASAKKHNLQPFGSIKWYVKKNGIALDDYEKFLNDNICEIHEKYQNAKDAYLSMNTAKSDAFLGVMGQKEDLSQGVATPLKIEFRPSVPTFPLRISSMAEGKTNIEVYVLSNFPVMDANKVLKIDASKVINNRLLSQLKPDLDVKAAQYVTRLSYDSDASGLNDDAVFGTSSDGPHTLNDKDKMEEQSAFEAMFMSSVSRYAEGGWYLEKAAPGTQELIDFMGKYPASKFFDDALMLLISTYLSHRSEPGKRYVEKVTVEDIKRLFDVAVLKPLHVEEETLIQAPEMLEFSALISAGIIKESLLLDIAFFYRYKEDRAMASQLAHQAYDALSLINQSEAAPRVKDAIKFLQYRAEQMFAETDLFREYADQGAQEYLKKNFGAAKEYFNKALAVSQNLLSLRDDDPMGGGKFVVPHVYFMLGKTSINLGENEEGRNALKKMISMAPNFRSSSPHKGHSEPGKEIWVSSAGAMGAIAFSYFKEGKIEEGIQMSEAVLPKLWNGQYAPLIIELHYETAVAYVSKGDRVKALEHLRQAIATDPAKSAAIKEKIRKSEAFKVLQQDKDFEALIS